MMFRSLLLLCVVSFLAVFSFCPVLVSSQSPTNLLNVEVDRVSATNARLRFLNAQPSQQTFTLIQYTSNSGQFGALTRAQYHSCLVFDPACPGTAVITPADREVNITQGVAHITSYILRGLTPSTTYYVRVAYLDTANPPTVQSALSPAPVSFTTPARSPLTTLDSLVASGGCGSLISTDPDGLVVSLVYLRDSIEAGVQVYSCDVVHTVSNVSLSVVPKHAYASIDSTPTSGYFSKTNQSASVSQKYVDPLPIYYNNTITLGDQGTTTNVSFIVTAESGVTKTYKLSIRRVQNSTTSVLRGPSSPVAAMIRSPSVPTNYSYRALLWDGTIVDRNSWKVWSDDLTVFPFSSFNITFNSFTGSGAIDYTLATISVTPAIANPIDGTCSNIYVGLFDTTPQRHSSVINTCVSALNDYCSATPFGAATKWQTFTNANGQFDPRQIFFPPPPTPGFPAA